MLCISPLALRSASECSHFRSYLALIKNVMIISNGSGIIALTNRHTHTHCSLPQTILVDIPLATTPPEIIPYRKYPRRKSSAPDVYSLCTVLISIDKMNNVCEGWNNGFRNLAGHQHPSIWILLGALQQDQAVASTETLQAARGQPPPKRLRRTYMYTQQHQLLYNLCCRRDGNKTVTDMLRALGHCVRLE